MIRLILNKLFWGFFRHLLSDKQYAKARFWLSTGRNLILNSPETFSEKINWLKLYDRTDLRRQVADRIEVRNYVKERVGEEHLIPLINQFEEFGIEQWELLPAQFVLKANHGSGMIKIVKEKQKEDPYKVIEEVKDWQQTDYSKFGREWVYRDLDRFVVAEQLLLNENGDVPEDFKFFCYHGNVKFIQVDIDRFKGQARNFYDREFNQLDVRLLHPKSALQVAKPLELEAAIEIAETLSKDFSFIRVDLFLLDGNIYFGEMTNFPGNGFEPFIPIKYDEVFGSHLKLETD